MLRQMTESSEEEIRNSEVLHRDAIQILNDKNKSLEEKLVFYERNYKEYDKVSGFVLKNRDIIGPNEMSLKLRDKEEEWKDQICIMKAEVEQTKKNADNLMVVNTVLPPISYRCLGIKLSVFRPSSPCPIRTSAKFWTNL